MKIVIFTIGTQGDARPFVALGRRLRALGHEIVIATAERHGALIRSGGIAHAPIRSDFADLMAREHAAMDTGNQLSVGRKMALALCDWVPVWVEQGMEATIGADLVIGSGSGTILGGSIAEKRRIPFVQAQFMPLTPSREIPPLWPAPRRRMPGAVNLAMSHGMRLTMWRLLSRPTAVVREELGLPAFPWRGPWYGANPHRPPVLYAFSRHLQPQPADWPQERSCVTGNWFHDEADSWQPPAGLARFLEQGDKPIYVGFGSMLSGKPQEFAQKIIEGVRRSGRRAVVASGWGAIDTGAWQSDDRLFFLDNAPHDWLFPRVALAVHHGGAGTVAAATRAGLPQVILPFVADQFFWSWRLKQVGLNPTMLSRRGLTPDALAQAIRIAQTSEVSARAAQFGALLREEDGIGNAIQALRQWGLMDAAPRPDATCVLQAAS